MNLSPRQLLAAGRMLVKQHAPYLYTAVLSMIPRETPGLGTFGVTDRWVLHWDPVWILELTPENVMAVLIHEVSHVLREHGPRCKSCGANPKLWNIAADCEINDDAAAMGLKLPTFKDKGDGRGEGTACFPKTFGFKDGDIAESYYAQLLQKAQEQKQKAKGKDGEGEGEEGEEDGSGGPGKPRAASGWCGSGAGRKLPDEQEPKDAKGNALGRSEADARRIKQHTAEEIKKAAARGQGNMPGGWDVWADSILKPAKVPWQKKLARRIRGAVAFQAGCVDYSYARPARRQAAYGYGIGRPVMPTLRAPRPRVGVALDTSGSMYGEPLLRAASEVQGILKAVRADVEFMACDCQVHTITKIKTVADFKRAFVGGGGTSFCPVFKQLEEMHSKPSILIFITDGCGDAPAEPPKGIHTIWVLVGDHKQHPHFHGGKEWGEIIEVDEDDVKTKAA